MITPRTLSGFKDRLPEESLPKREMLNSLMKTFEFYGFAPIETPHLEYAEILKKQGSEEIQKELYSFFDHGGREVALRFDLTVPLARFIAQHKNTLGLPFKRYAIGNVFRGERAQRGRYREFTQCDFDFIGSESLGCDVEIVCVIYSALEHLGLREFVISVNHRQVLNGICEILGFSNVTECLRIIDKLDKIGKDGVLEEFAKIGYTHNIAELLDFIAHKDSDYKVTLAYLETFSNKSEALDRGISDLKTFFELLEGLIPSSSICIDLSIARGLGYYTGIIYETHLSNLKNLGSVCSGGRYDNLTQNFSKELMSGVGASIGLDRLLAGLEELGLINGKKTPADILVISLDNLMYAYKSAKELRDNHIKVEVYPESKLKKAMQYANNKGYEWVVILGEEEMKTQSFTLKNFQSGVQHNCIKLKQMLEILGKGK